MTSMFALTGIPAMARIAIVLLGITALGLAYVPPVKAADEVVHFDNPDHRVMYQALLKEYRCLKCQNQNLWDSNASLAGDLRREIREQILAGKNQNDIDEYLVARYGEFVLYRPRFNSTTALLWIGPFVLLLIGLMSLVVMVRNKARATRENQGNRVLPAGESNLHAEGKLARARDLLKD